jgi:hypothetical protein
MGQEEKMEPVLHGALGKVEQHLALNPDKGIRLDLVAVSRPLLFFGKIKLARFTGFIKR